MESLTLTDVGPDDEAALFQLFAVVKAEDLGMRTWDASTRARMLRLQFEAERRGYRERFPGASQRVISRDGSPVGRVVVDRTGRALRCVDIAIMTSVRSQGIGTRVVRLLQEEAASAGLPLTLSVLHMNERALTLYLRLGFRAVGETDLHTQMEWRP